jgi:hypothetical protein
VTPLDLLSAHRWERVAFTTYALSLSFFEAVILDALVRGDTSAQPFVLADVHGVRESLSEQGAHRVGKDYEVEPLAVSGGVFHPKITVLASREECHLLVGSGNLTFNGWGGNCEVIEHLHPSFAADAISDGAEFFERLLAHNRVRHGVSRQCALIASMLRRATQGRRRNGQLRLLHNLDSSLISQLAQAADDLGGARRLVAAAPFWDSGTALDNLCRALRINEAFLHAHAGGCVEGTIASNWPRNAHVPIQAVRVAPLNARSEASRRLHAKMFEIRCRRGRLIVSGSANGTVAALGPDGNIEACVMRIGRDAKGWSWVPAERPELPTFTLESSGDERKGAGVLRAEIEGDRLTGQVLTPRMRGAISIYHMATVGPEWLADATLDSEGAFGISTSDLESRAWRGARLALRVIDTTGQSAEGFVSLVNFGEITRRGGAVARRLLAVIFGTEGPEDVRAILNWFLENPERLSRNRERIGGAGEVKQDDESEQLIPVDSLRSEFVGGVLTAKSHAGGDRRWSRFIDQVLAAFREPREPFVVTVGEADGDHNDEPPVTNKRLLKRKRAIDKAYVAFDRLFAQLTRNGCPQRDAEIAFDLTGFICARLRPDKMRVRVWLVAVIRACLSAGVRPERRADVAAAVLTVMGTAPDSTSARFARSSLLQLGYDLAASPPPSDSVRNYQTVLVQHECFAELWARVLKVRSYQEQVRAYVKALECGEARPDDYPDLPIAAADVWLTLERALKSPQASKQLLFVDGSRAACPLHKVSLPKYELDKLRTIGIATSKNCCGKVLIRREA